MIMEIKSGTPNPIGSSLRVYPLSQQGKHLFTFDNLIKSMEKSLNYLKDFILMSFLIDSLSRFNCLATLNSLIVLLKPSNAYSKLMEIRKGNFKVS